MADVVFRPMGVIHSPFVHQKGTPVQPSFGEDTRGRVVVDPPYVAALADLAEFDRVWLLFVLHRARPWKPTVVPYRDVVERGLFATRAPARPNPIGMSVVKLLSIDGDTLAVEGVDILDGTPLLDIKPYVPRFDAWPDAAAGWLDRSPQDRQVADDRFGDE